MNCKGLLIIFLGLLFWTFSSYASGMDSLGIKTEASGTYVLHQVESKETLFSLSSRYGTSVASIVEINQITGNNLSVGSTLRIPWKYGLTHIVTEGETLYSISGMYQKSVERIKELNGLHSNTLEVGRSLTIVKPEAPQDRAEALVLSSNNHIVGIKETLYSISRQYSITLDDLKQWNGLPDNYVRAGDTLIVLPTTSESTAEKRPEQVTTASASPEITVADNSELESSSKIREEVTPVKENGIAAVINGATDTRKYLALHAAAPVGTIMRVRNEMTNLSVFVRVVGKLPATGENNNVLIRLSRAAQEALGALDSKFRVELSYVPNQ